MKHLNQFITEYIVKKKLDKPIDSEDHYEYYPKTKQELIYQIKQLIEQNIYDFNCIDTSEITDMSDLFRDIDINKNFDVSKWDVSNVTNIKNMNFMFYDCKKLNCDLSNWNVSKVEDTTVMFYNCNSLKNKPKWYK